MFLLQMNALLLLTLVIKDVPFNCPFILEFSAPKIETLSNTKKLRRILRLESWKKHLFSRSLSWVEQALNISVWQCYLPLASVYLV